MEQTIQIKILRKNLFMLCYFSLQYLYSCAHSVNLVHGMKYQRRWKSITARFYLTSVCWIMYKFFILFGFFFFECRGHLCQYCSCRVTSHHSECPENIRSILRLLQSLIIIVPKGRTQINIKAIQFECTCMSSYLRRKSPGYPTTKQASHWLQVLLHT